MAVTKEQKKKYNQYSYAAEKAAVQIPTIRKLVGLPQIKTGLRECLTCEKEFMSEDLKNQHCCDDCRRE